MDIDAHLRGTLEDRRLSRKEKKALRASLGPSPGTARAEWHARAFVTDDRSVVSAYAEAFEELWQAYGGS